MGKDKKKHSKKDRASDDLLDMAALSIKKFRKVTKEIGKLSTGQKLVGGIALAAAGLAYLAAQETDAAPATEAEDDDSGPAHLLSGRPDEEEAAPPRHKSRKASKARFVSRADSDD